MKIHVVTVVGSHLAVFDHMLRHYRDMGLDSIFVNIHLRHYGDPLYERVCEITHRYGARICAVFVGCWVESLNPYLYRHAREQYRGDWFLIADSDELQVYDGNIETIIKSVDAEGYDWIEGFVVDRVSETGEFSAVNSDLSLWDQFPLAGLITFPLLRGNMLKIAAAKNWVRVAPGQHYAWGSAGCPREKCWVPIHHFKWTADLQGRLQARVEFYKEIGDGLWIESERCIRYLNRNGGKIAISEPAFKLRKSSQFCPHEELLKSVILKSAPLMPRPQLD